MRLIDADSLYYKVKCECNPYGKPTIDYESGNKVLDWIDNAPTVPNRYDDGYAQGYIDGQTGADYDERVRE